MSEYSVFHVCLWDFLIHSYRSLMKLHILAKFSFVQDKLLDSLLIFQVGWMGSPLCCNLCFYFLKYFFKKKKKKISIPVRHWHSSGWPHICFNNDTKQLSNLNVSNNVVALMRQRERKATRPTYFILWPNCFFFFFGPKKTRWAPSCDAINHPRHTQCWPFYYFWCSFFFFFSFFSQTLISDNPHFVGEERAGQQLASLDSGSSWAVLFTWTWLLIWEGGHFSCVVCVVETNFVFFFFSLFVLNF